jgi:hypothetical protein
MGWLLYADSFLLCTQRKLFLKKGDFLVIIQYCLICCSSDSTVSEDAEIKARTIETLVLAVRRSNHATRLSSTTHLDLISSTLN